MADTSSVILAKMGVFMIFADSGSAIL